MNRFLPVLGGLAGCVGLLGGCQSPSTGGDGRRFFVEQVKPILERNCLQCHNGQGAMRGKLDLRNRQAAFDPAGKRPFIVPGDPDGSLLIEAVSRKGAHSKMMPRLDLSLTADEIAVLREWIQDGAAWPEGKTGVLAARPNPER